jgi:hypothetical protein
MAFVLINDVNFKSHVNVRGKSIFSFIFSNTKSYNTIVDLNANVTTSDIIVNYMK